MKRYAGVWIDHEKACIVMISNGKGKVSTIKSNIAGHVRLSGGARSKSPYGPQDVASEKKGGREKKAPSAGLLSGNYPKHKHGG
mgnify:CR=1 FL=1